MSFIKKLHDEIAIADKNNDITREQFLKNIKLVNITTLKTIPDYINTVPTIIVNNINVPLSGLDAFTWLDKSKYFYKPTNNIKHNVSQTDVMKDNFYANSQQNIVVNDNIKNKKSDVFANLKDEDDDIITNTKFNGATQNTTIIDTNKGLIDGNGEKPNADAQTQKIDSLIIQRKYQMQQFINGSKKR